MVGFSEEILQDMKKMETLFTTCDHILEEEVSEQTIREMQDRVQNLREQSEAYKHSLQDQEDHSRSPESRGMAALLLTEDREIEARIKRQFPDAGDRAGEETPPADVNVGALYVEYLTGRAMQSIRIALIGAMNLKLLSEDRKKKPDRIRTDKDLSA